MAEINKAIKIFKKNKCPVIPMHSVSIYPCPLEKLNLKMVRVLLKLNINVMLVIQT